VRLRGVLRSAARLLFSTMRGSSPTQRRGGSPTPERRQLRAEHRKRELDDLDAHESFVEDLVPWLKPLTLIGLALVLSSLHSLIGGRTGDELGDADMSALLDMNARALHHSHDHTARYKAERNQSATCTRTPGANRTLACRMVHDETHALVGYADPDPLGNESRRPGLPCPGFPAATGRHNRTAEGPTDSGGSLHGSSWTVACGLPPVAVARPRVYVYTFMDDLHRELLRSPLVAKFFDLWHAHSMYLSEFAFHRSLAAGDFATEDPDEADFFFVPFYSRLAFELRRANASMHRAMLAQLHAGLLASPHYARSRGRDHILIVSSARPMAALYQQALPLIASSILLKVEMASPEYSRGGGCGGLDCGKAAGGKAGGGKLGGGGSDGAMAEASLAAEAAAAPSPRPNHVAVPYFVPWLPLDDALPDADTPLLGVAADTPWRRYSVCLQAAPDKGKLGDRGAKEARRLQVELFRAFKGYPRALLRRPSERVARDADTPRIPLPNPRFKHRNGTDAAGRVARGGADAPSHGRPVYGGRRRALACSARRSMRECEFCVVPRGPLTPSSPRFYEALAAQCVPIVLSDGFVLPYGTSAQGRRAVAGGLWPAGSELSPWMLRIAEADAAQAPRLLRRAAASYAEMQKALRTYRAAFLYELPADGQSVQGGAVCAVLADVSRRFTPHLAQWRDNSTVNGPDFGDVGVAGSDGAGVMSLANETVESGWGDAARPGKARGRNGRGRGRGKARGRGGRGKAFGGGAKAGGRGKQLGGGGGKGGGGMLKSMKREQRQLQRQQRKIAKQQQQGVDP